MIYLDAFNVYLGQEWGLCDVCLTSFLVLVKCKEIVKSLKQVYILNSCFNALLYLAQRVFIPILLSVYLG